MLVFGFTELDMWRRGVLLCSIFILLSRESDCGAILWTNPHPLRSCPMSIFEFSVCFFDFLPPNLLLIRSRQAVIIIVKLLIQGNYRDEDGS